MTAILGISAFYHDSAAALVVDGRLVAAAQEERFSRKKHDEGWPGQSIAFCLEQAGLRPEELDFVAFYEKPILKFERLLQTYRSTAPAGYASFRRAMPLWLKDKLHLRKKVRRELAGFSGKLVFSEHHESHAASAFYPSPFDEAAIITMDGVGEWATACYGVGRGNRLELAAEMRFPHSLGLLYSAFTAYCGFRVNNGEYKLMGLASYGEPKFKDKILDELLDLKDDGSFRMDMSYFGYCHGLTMTSNKFHQLFGGLPRKMDAEIDQRIMDLAASVQGVTEEIMLRVVRHVHARTKAQNLVLAGGVALNCVANARIRDEGPFENVWVQPAAGDAGGALGVAQFVWHQLLGKPREVTGETCDDGMSGALLGPEFSDEDVSARLKAKGAVFTTCESDERLCGEVARLLEQQKVVGWFQGRMEFSPRALGARSILADPRDDGMQAVLNQKIKFRESFRPFAPSVLHDHVDDWMKVADDDFYMTFVASVKPSSRDKIPAVTHVDGSTRLQTVDERRSPLFHQLLSLFHERTGCPMLVNTSFNLRGEPVVCTPEDALQCFLMTGIDVLVVGRHVLLKEEQPRLPSESDREAHRERLRLGGDNVPTMFSSVDRNPTRSRLLQFAGMFLAFLMMLGWFWGAGPTVLSALGCVGLGGLALAFAVPEVVKPVYITMNCLAAPLQWLVKEIALLVAFVAVFVPMALWLRMTKRDVLVVARDEDVETYWVERAEPDAASYYRQF